MSFNWSSIGFGLGLAATDIIAFPIVKYVSLGARPIWLLLAVLVYSMNPIILLQSLKIEGLAVINLLWNTLSNILITVIGVYMFKEKISSIKKLGIVLSIISIGLLTYEG
jgi:multidrug transporter EmrE-like cation transporter